MCKNFFIILLIIGLIGAFSSLQAEEKTGRDQQLETSEVSVWKTTIFPHQPLKMHRHEHKRIVVALTDTRLKVMNDKGISHEVFWKKGTAHLLVADKKGECHVDINESNHPMQVMVIEFKK